MSISVFSYLQANAEVWIQVEPPQHLHNACIDLESVLDIDSDPAGCIQVGMYMLYQMIISLISVPYKQRRLRKDLEVGLLGNKSSEESHP